MTGSDQIFQSFARAPRLKDYLGTVPDEQLEDVYDLSRSLRGAKVVHINSTAVGGGVAEILQSMTPLMQSLGIDAEWYVMPGVDEFFNVTKQLHNMLQGAEGELPQEMWDTYINHVRKAAGDMQRQGIDADAWIMHDPQTLPLATFLPTNDRAAWVCHIDTTAPNPSLLERVIPWSAPYSRTVFSLDQYVMPRIAPDRVRVIPPAIDPLRKKNLHPGHGTIKATLRKLGIDTNRPLLVQVSRFDRWKDPMGVIDAYRIVKKEMPAIQLALVGVIEAKDDPEAFAVVDEVRRYAGNDPDIYLYTDPEQVRELEVASFQAGADVVIQKSLREGFGLVVAEALWKAAPMVGGNVGGIKLQIVDGETGYLVDTPEECAARALKLLEDRQFAQQLGSAGKEWVRNKFLLPRLLRDYLQVCVELVEGGKTATAPALDAVIAVPTRATTGTETAA